LRAVVAMASLSCWLDFAGRALRPLLPPCGTLCYAAPMSLAEVKDELRKMTPEERKEVARALIELEENRDPQPAVRDFAEAKAYVFDNYGELLRRLAQ
jgi:hypothetical protein